MSENVVADFGWSTGEGPESCGYLAPCVLEILRGLPVGRVLDLGAGNGALCGELANAGYKVVGVEYDLHGVRLAKQAHPGIPFYNFGVQDDPSQLLEQERKFDAVVSTEVIEHLFSPHLLPAYAERCLNTGGYLIISTPYHGYLKNLALALFNKWDAHHTTLWHGGHIKFWSSKTLAALLSVNGFKVIQFHGVGRMRYLWKSMVLVAKKI